MKTTLIFIAFLLVPAVAMAALRNQGGLKHADAQFLLNQSANPGVASQARLGLVLKEQKGVAQGQYSFAVQGGAVGTVNLKDADGKDLKLPANAIITNVIIDVLTAPTSGGSATIAVSAVSAGDLLAATAIGSVTGIVQGIPANSVGTAIKLASEKTVTASIAVAALTAGKFNVQVEYIVSE